MLKSATGSNSFQLTFRNRLNLVLLCVTAASMICRAQPKPPARLPDFQFKLLDGTVVKSPDLKGRIVVVEFWGTWCKPCLAEIPDYNAFYSKYKDKGVYLMALAVDSGSEEKVREATKRLGILYPVAAPKLSDLDVFGDISAVPTTWIVDRAGQVNTVFVGSASEKQRALRQTVDRLLKN